MKRIMLVLMIVVVIAGSVQARDRGGEAQRIYNPGWACIRTSTNTITAITANVFTRIDYSLSCGISSGWDIATSSITCTKTDVQTYLISVAMSASYSVANTLVRWKFYKNGVDIGNNEQQRHYSTVNDQGNTAMVFYCQVAINDILSLWTTANKNGSLDIEHLNIAIIQTD